MNFLIFGAFWHRTLSDVGHLVMEYVSYKYIKELLKRIINVLLKYTRTVLYTK
jgi:hypothetical protein